MTAAEEFTVNLSARLTDDEYYGSAWTGAAKVAWRPISSLLIRGTAGTSYRAPNLRELFLRAQTGFLSLFDPCLIPDSAIDDISGGYNSSRRQPRTACPGQLPRQRRRSHRGQQQWIQHLQRRSRRRRFLEPGRGNLGVLRPAPGLPRGDLSAFERLELSGPQQHLLRDRHRQHDHRTERPVHHQQLLLLRNRRQRLLQQEIQRLRCPPARSSTTSIRAS